MDLRKGACYQDTREAAGQLVCGTRLGEQLGRSACCCGAGVAWGPSCEVTSIIRAANDSSVIIYPCFQACPAPGTAEYKLVCPGGRGFQPNEETVILEDIDECGAMER